MRCAIECSQWPHQAALPEEDAASTAARSRDRRHLPGTAPAAANRNMRPGAEGQRADAGLFQTGPKRHGPRLPTHPIPAYSLERNKRTTNFCESELNSRQWKTWCGWGLSQGTNVTLDYQKNVIFQAFSISSTISTCHHVIL